MHRRRALQVVGYGALVAVAGCTSGANGPGPAEDPTDSTEEAPTDTPHGTSSANLSSRLRIASDYDGEEPLSIRLVEAETDADVYHETYETGWWIALDLSASFEPGVTYELTIAVGDERAFERPIYPYEALTLSVSATGEVDVVELVEV